jgi:hypothetical protein
MTTQNFEQRCYEEDLKQHLERIITMRMELKRMCGWLKSYYPNKETWTLEELQNSGKHLIDMAESMDAPNKPGYYRANND